MPETKTRNLHEKLLEVQRAVTHLQKTAKSGDGQYAYVSSSQVLGAIREKMDEEGLLLEVQVVGHALHIDAAYSHLEKKQHFTEVTLEMTWVNVDEPKERETFQWYGQGIDSGEKGVGKALTYAEKYFMLKFFHVPTDADDPDAHSRPNSGAKAEPRQQQESSGDSSGEFGPCPECGGELHLRKRKDGSGQFVACTNYPKCEFTCNVEEAPRPEGDFDGPVDAANLKDEAAEVFGDDLPGVTKYSELKAWMQDDLGVGEDELTPLRNAGCHVCFGVVPKVADISASNWQQLMGTIRDAVQSGDVAGFIADVAETKA